MICSKCQHENRKDRRFCSRCGEPLSQSCRECGFSNDPGDSFCGGCGKGLRSDQAAVDQAGQNAGKLSAGDVEAERRQVTILFADLSGFTNLSVTQSQENLHRVMHRYFEEVDEVVVNYGGTVDKHIGDAVMALFGAPITHDNDHERAIHSALDIHARLEALSQELGIELKAHIGIASGQVVASGIGSASHSEYTVLGESVNLAARLVDLAKPDETLISDTVCQALLHLLSVESIGGVKVKGIEDAVDVWRLLGLKGEGAAQSTTPLFGRQRELHQFKGILDNFNELKSGQAIYVRGTAGIGKSRLVEEFSRLATAEGFTCHSALVLNFGVGNERHCIRMLLQSLLNLAPGQDVKTRKEVSEQAMTDKMLKPDQEMFLHDLLDLPQLDEYREIYDAMDNQVRIRGKHDTVLALLRYYSRGQPLMIIIEDLHWADQLTLVYMARICEIAGQIPLLLVMTSRAESDPLDHAWHQSRGQAALTTIDLAPLSNEEALELAGEFFDLSSKFAIDCVQRAEGNPLFLEQLLRSAQTLGKEDVPGSIRSIVLARVDCLEKKDKQGLQAAAVLGQRFSPEVLSYLIEDSSWDGNALVTFHLVRPDGEEFSFSHALIWESIYSTLLQEQLRKLHSRAAQWYATRDLSLRALHLERAGSSSAAMAYLDVATEQCRTYHYDHAQEHAEKGLKIVRDRGERHALEMCLGQCLVELGKPDDSIRMYEQALESATTDVSRCRAWIGLASGMRIIDAFDRAFEILEKAESTASGDIRLYNELSQIHYYRGNLFFPLGNIEGCLEQHQLALQYARQSNSSESEARALGGLGDAHYSKGQMVKAHDYFLQCVKQSEESGFGSIAVSNRYMVAWTQLYMKQVDASLQGAELAVESAVRAGQPRAEMVARLTKGRTLLEAGSYNEARVELENGLEVAESLKADRFKPFFQIFMSRLPVSGPEDLDDLITNLEGCIAHSRDSGMGFLGPWLLSSLSLISGDSGVRKSALQEAEKTLESGCVGHNYLAFYPDAIEVALAENDWQEVKNRIQALTQYMASEPLPLCEFYINRAQALMNHAINPGDSDARDALVKVRDDAKLSGLHHARHAIETALQTR